jgi:mannitol-1-/sugar-/sorbitol-6-phosphatase
MALVAGVEAVLLDMDGTLVDSDAAVERAWSTWATEHALEPAAALAIAHGNPAETTVQALLPALGPVEVAESAARQLALQYDDLADVTPTDGAQRLVAVLTQRAWPWAIVTTADRRLAAARLAAAGLAAAGLAVPVLVTAEDVAAGKPDPEGYLLAARRLGVPPPRCLVVEDTATGLAAGRAAGALTAALKGNHGDLRLAHLGELADLLEAGQADHVS